MQKIHPFILASSSPRRLALLRQAGVEPSKILAPDIDECPLAGELPRPYALRLAEAKRDAACAKAGAEPAFIIAADTVVACGRRILPKTESRASAVSCLTFLSGRRHRVYTGVAALAPDGRTNARVVLTVVKFKSLTSEQLNVYLDSGEWQGKAGGYAIQGRADAFVTAINGSYSNVVGLPLQVTMDMLSGLGWRGDLAWPRTSSSN